MSFTYNIIININIQISIRKLTNVGVESSSSQTVAIAAVIGTREREIEPLRVFEKSFIYLSATIKLIARWQKIMGI